jgi:hypothetical protein
MSKHPTFPFFQRIGTLNVLIQTSSMLANLEIGDTLDVLLKLKEEDVEVEDLKDF